MSLYVNKYDDLKEYLAMAGENRPCAHDPAENLGGQEKQVISAVKRCYH